MLTKHALCAADPTRLFWDKFKTATENRCWRYTQAPLALHLSIGPSFHDSCGIVSNMTTAACLHTKLWLSDQNSTVKTSCASFAYAASTPERFFAPNSKHNRSSILTKISVPLSIDIEITNTATAAAKTGAQDLLKCKTSSGLINAKVRLATAAHV